MMNKIDRILRKCRKTDGPTSVGFYKKRSDSVKEICVSDSGSATSHLSNVIGAAAIIETMNEMAQEDRLRSPRNVGPSKRKKARPENKSKRKMAQASRKRNR
jgi:hypothetical protein